ncbi:MAG: prepilin-type N-terminal cleavage/methylation domain-containing protein [Nitrospirae bacterium]|nr:prepilin-type N-terminal cleavage/methylation domain-containing protein [Nitrospirota bacterium]
MSNKLINEKGVTLVEVLISLVILLLVFMGLIQASLLSIDHNLRNEIRDEAVQVGAEYMTMTRSTPWTSLTDTAGLLESWTTSNRQFRNLGQTYFVRRQIDDLDTNNKRVAIEVDWTYRAETLRYTASTTVTR